MRRAYGAFDGRKGDSVTGNDWMLPMETLNPNCMTRSILCCHAILVDCLSPYLTLTWLALTLTVTHITYT